MALIARKRIHDRNPNLPFTAKFAGRCTICGNTFPEGATVRRFAGRMTHAGCSKGRTDSTPTVREADPRHNWELDKNHQPHSMSTPCEICDDLFGPD